ncbi:MAG: hypothetical protein GQ564_03565 [Bacteroidales bacterium]|nr:hypothetical protein [Bacteroidales bacterium]
MFYNVMEENSINKESIQTTTSSKLRLSWFYKIIYWHSGARLYILEKCLVYNKLFGIGAIVIMIGVMDSISEEYLLNTVFNNFVIAILVGIIGGILTFSLDWYVIPKLEHKTTLKLIKL